MEALQRLHNRGSIGGYDIDNSLKFEADNTEYLEKTFSSDGNRKTYTTSMWIKRTEIGQASTLFGAQPASGATDETTAQFGITSDDKFQCGFQNFYVVQTNRLLRDTAAWYHIVVRIDTTQSTAGDRFKVWINGEEETSFSTDNRTSITQNQNTGINSTSPHRVGALIGNSWYFSGYMAEVHHVDGQSLSPSDFAETDTDTGIWKPKAYTGSYGTNGFYLDFEDSASLGADDSGNGNNFTLTNITSADQALDTPTNNFCTQSAVATFLNRTPQTRHAANGATASEDSSVTNAWTGAVGTVALFKGKWYWEVQGQQSTVSMSGIHSFVGDTGSSTLSPHQSDNSFFVIHNNGSNVSALGKTISGTTTYPISTGNEFTHQSHVGIALDLDNSLMTYYINNGSAGTNLTNINISDITNIGDPVIPFVGIYRYRIRTNFGGYVETNWGTGQTDANGYGDFKYAPPTGYYAICSKNLAEYGG